MTLMVQVEPMARLEEHAGISIAFVVERELEITAAGGGLGGLAMREVPVDQPWVKDYDADAGEGPTRWPRRFDVTNWGLLAAFDNGRRIGGAVVAFDTPNVHMLRGRKDMAVLWDIRVDPDRRGRAIGSALFRSVEAWARDRGCRLLKIETQNINVPACRFYARMGCALGGIDRFAYPDLPGEAQLLWYQEL